MNIYKKSNKMTGERVCAVIYTAGLTWSWTSSFKQSYKTSDVCLNRKSRSVTSYDMDEVLHKIVFWKVENHTG